MPSTTNPQQSSSSSVWTKSTIYKRHEKRRAKTIQNANDDRPALVRILAQLRPAAAAVVPMTMVDATAPVNVVDTDTTTAFTMHHSSSTVQTPQYHNTAVTAGYAALSAALGARLADAGMTLLSKSLAASSSSASVPRTFAAPFLEASGSSLSLRFPAAPAAAEAVQAIVSATPSKSSGLFLRAPTTAAPRSSSLLLLSCCSPSVLPLVVLFGTQAAVLSAAGSSGDTMTATLVASSVAGAALSVVRTAASRRRTMLQESGAAVLYFGSYKMVRRTWGRDDHPMGSAAIAGAMAGTLYEAVRGQALFASSSSFSSPFARPVVSLARAAPAHALFFVGYETVQSLLA